MATYRVHTTKMATYHVHTIKMASGDHEVHLDHCEWCPPLEQTHELGRFKSSHEAIKSAKRIFPQAHGCHHCLPKHYKLPEKDAN